MDTTLFLLPFIETHLERNILYSMFLLDQFLQSAVICLSHCSSETTLAKVTGSFHITNSEHFSLGFSATLDNQTICHFLKLSAYYSLLVLHKLLSGRSFQSFVTYSFCTFFPINMGLSGFSPLHLSPWAFV